MSLQAVERALSEARQAEVSAAALGELCDSLRADEADLRQRLAALHARANAAAQETTEAETKRTAVVEVPLAVSADYQLSTMDISHWPVVKLLGSAVQECQTSRQCQRPNSSLRHFVGAAGGAAAVRGSRPQRAALGRGCSPPACRVRAAGGPDARAARVHTAGGKGSPCSLISQLLRE